MKFVNICSLTLSLIKSTDIKLWYIMRFCVNPVVPNVRYTPETVRCLKANVMYKWRPLNGVPYAALFYFLAYCLSHQIFNSNSRRLIMKMATALAQWLRHCATNRKVAGSIPDCVIVIFHRHNPSDCTMTLGSTQPLTEMSTRRISWG
jgi:hypothetical protein